MKTNFFQKLIIFAYLLLLFIFSILLIPFKNYSDEISFGSIWSVSDIEFERLFLEIFFITALCFILYFVFRNFKEPDFNSLKTKKTVRREFIYFVTIILSVTLFWIFMSIHNKINRTIQQELRSTNDQLIRSSYMLLSNVNSKNQIRSSFFEDSKIHFDLSGYNNDIDKYWEWLYEVRSDVLWKNYYLSHFSQWEISQYNISTPEDFTLFIERNQFYKIDLVCKRKASDKKKILTANISQLDNLTFYNVDDMNNNLIKITLVLLGLIYVFRFGIIYLFKLLSYIKF